MLFFASKQRSTKHYTIKGRGTRTPLKPAVNSGALEWLAVPAPLVTPVVLLLTDTNII